MFEVLLSIIGILIASLPVVGFTMKQKGKTEASKELAAELNEQTLEAIKEANDVEKAIEATDSGSIRDIGFTSVRDNKDSY